MMLMSLLLAAVTFNPAGAPRPQLTATEGYIQAPPISPDATCKPGKICASKKFYHNGCFFNNFWNGTNGGTPLAIDVTQTGPQGSVVYVYWVNNTNTNIAIKGNAEAKYYCVI
jgi:hypothetical protein